MAIFLLTYIQPSLTSFTIGKKKKKKERRKYKTEKKEQQSSKKRGYMLN
jgi:hypothetical protein